MGDPDIILKDLKDIKTLANYLSGIYLFKSNLYSLYVGSSIDIKKRIRSHKKKKRINFVGIKEIWIWKINDLESLGYREQEIYNRFVPRLNKCVIISR